MSKYKILVAEDDKNLGFVIQDYLLQNGFNVVLCENGRQALETFSETRFDICVLDVMMPKLDGFTLAKKIKTADNNMPVIFLTAKEMKEDKLNGFAIGADDYITKPFDIDELIARINAILKRSNNLKEQQITDYAKIGLYEFDYSNRLLKFGNEEQHLTKREADLLKYLSEHRNTTIPRENLLLNIWGTDDYFAGRSMDVFISKMRKYLKKDPNISINNIHGVGFKFLVK
ncbi:MAG TPA: DNA-binding response regulator [Flavobacteriales bacterium]|nr:DNA-binding response regulator [Flavobacteriales bacterium]|tara:strand:+ start:58253 stop:58942 length:690 start_codon:yes stop_codon:yes gene_type:complete